MAELQCWCRRCEQAATPPMPRDEAGPTALLDWLCANTPRFIVCPTCGNKRCPRATAHWLACTGSNDSGQAGSDYGPTPATEMPPDTPATQSDPQ